MDIINGILWPLKWVIEAILVLAHEGLTAIGLPSSSGIVWVLSVVVLVIVIRAAMIPLFVKQIKSQRAMLALAPDLKKLQAKYKGKTDQLSRQAMAQEQMALYKRHGSNPMSSCLPLLVQFPVFFGLYSVINEAQKGVSGVGMLTAELSSSFAHASFFGAPLSATLANSWGQNWRVVVIASLMVAVMIGSQFYTQLQIVGKNVSPETAASPMYKQQKMLMYFIPFIMVFSGVAFPLGVVFYWLTSNIWTMAQQAIIIRNNPTPGSEADLARKERLRLKGKLEDEESDASSDKPTGQRQQPVSKARAKKQKGK